MCNYLNDPMAIKEKLYCRELLIAAIVGCRSVEVIKKKRNHAEIGVKKTRDMAVLRQSCHGV